MTNLLKQFALRWSHPTVADVRIQIPWDSNLPQYGRYHYAFAKGTRDQILSYTETNCPHRTKPEIEAWMKGRNQWDIHVGIDCAGYVYRLLDEGCQAAGVARLPQTLGYTCEYTDVDRLTPIHNPRLAERLSRADQVQVGDVIRFDYTPHAGVIIDTVYSPEGRLLELWYSHANQARGPHIGWIDVGDPSLDIGHSRQTWYDEMWDGNANNGLRDNRYQYVCRTHYYHAPRPTTLKTTGIRVFVDGREVWFAVPTMTLNGHTIVRIRNLAEAMGAQMDYSDDTEILVIQKGNKRVQARVGSERAEANGVSVTLEQTPELRNAWLYAPLRFVAEGLGYRVTWDGATNSIGLFS